jgi:predicted aminopeptidase
MLKYRSRLSDFYERSASAEEKRAGKQRLFVELDEEYRALKASWGGYSGYDRLFARGANNALLASIASYSELVPAFRELLAQKQGDLAAFYAAAKALGGLEKPEREARLSALSERR